MRETARLHCAVSANACPEGATVRPAKGAALERTAEIPRFLGPTAQRFSSPKNGWPVGPRITLEWRRVFQGRPGNAGCPPSLGEPTAFSPKEFRRTGRSAASGGMTLVELLVVLSIILMLAAVTLPRLKPEMDRSRIREAARSIQLYLSSARNQAMATGRSCGVMIERLSAEPGCSMSLTQVETPVRYGGDTTTSFATVAYSSSLSSAVSAACTITLYSAPGTQAGASLILHAGDQVQIGYQGSPITLAVSGSNGAYPVGTKQLLGVVDISHGEMPPWTAPPYTISGPFNILRMPTKSAAASLQLPSPACIDLMWSGFDPPPPPAPSTWGAYDDNPVIIMFGPNGSVDKIYANTGNGNGYTWMRPTTPICLLVGRRDEVVDPVDTAGTNAKNNLNDFTNLWVGINASTGMIVVTDLAATGMGAPPTAALYSGSVLQQSRIFARQSDAMGGK